MASSILYQQSSERPVYHHSIDSSAHVMNLSTSAKGDKLFSIDFY